MKPGGKTTKFLILKLKLRIQNAELEVIKNCVSNQAKIRTLNLV